MSEFDRDRLVALLGRTSSAPEAAVDAIQRYGFSALLEGRTATTQEISDASGLSADELGRGIDGLTHVGRLEMDDERVIGVGGLTLSETVHSLVLLPVARIGTRQDDAHAPGVHTRDATLPGGADSELHTPDVALSDVALSDVALSDVAIPGVALSGVAKAGVDQPAVQLREVDLHTWCALDAIGIPVALGLGGEIETRCPQCGSLLRVDVVNGLASSRDGVMLFCPTSSCENVRADFCSAANLFCSTSHIDEWRRLHPEAVGESLDLEATADLGRAMWKRFTRREDRQ